MNASPRGRCARDPHGAVQDLMTPARPLLALPDAGASVGGPHASGRVWNEVTSYSIEKLQEPRRTSIPAARNRFFSGRSMNPQMIRRGCNSRTRSHTDFVPERSRGWNRVVRPVGSTSRTPSHLLKNGQSKGKAPDFMTNKAVCPARADFLDAAFVAKEPRAPNIKSN